MPSSQDFNLNRNVAVMIQRTDTTDETRYQGYLIGNIHKDLLVIGGIAVDDIKFGENLIIRMVLENEVVGFVSTVREIARAPARMYFVSFPEKWETVNLRKSLRLNVFFPAEIQAKNPVNSDCDIHLLKAMMLNISKGGCFFSSRLSVKSDSDVRISFSLPGETHVHSVSGKVIHNLPKNSVHAQRVKFSGKVENVTGLAAVRKWIDQNHGFAMN